MSGQRKLAKSTKALCMCMRWQVTASKACYLVLALPLLFVVVASWSGSGGVAQRARLADPAVPAEALAAAPPLAAPEAPPEAAARKFAWKPYSERPSPPALPKARPAAAAVVATPAPAPVSKDPVWIFCAEQWQECWCKGKVRWGVGERWHEILPKKEGEELHVKCRVGDLPDVAPGDGSKHCQCQVQPGSSFFKSLNPGLIIGGGAHVANNCEKMEAGASDGDWGAQLWVATEAFCSPAWERSEGAAKAGPIAISLAKMRELMTAWIDERFVENYNKFFDGTGWAEKGFVNYYAGPPGGRHTAMTEELVKSVHLFSKEMIVVFHFGFATPSHWTPELYPQLVLLHASPIPVSAHRSFNFNKFRAMILARVKIGVELDSDQFVAPGVDAIFPRTKDEVTKDYPMPILPVHFLDRTPRDLGAYWARYCPQNVCKWQTARWGHAHPTWTFWGLPFLGRWLRRNFRDETLPEMKGGSMSALRITNIPEDEDLLNVGTWEEGGTKQWCKLDLPGPSDFDALLAGSANSRDCNHGACGNIGGDQRYHPGGAAKAFYTAHHAVDIPETKRYVERLKQKRETGLPPPILFNRKFYKDGAELKAANPQVACII